MQSSDNKCTGLHLCVDVSDDLMSHGHENGTKNPVLILAAVKIQQINQINRQFQQFHAQLATTKLVLHNQNMLTKSARAMYRNEPAAIASNHSLAAVLLVPILTPIKNPTMAVSEERKLNIRAVNQCIPDFTRIPKSAKEKE